MAELPPSKVSPWPLLALDTATEQIAAGLQTGRGAFTCTVAGGAAASTRLLPELKRLLDHASMGWNDLRLIAFGQGPGAFTGLRTACAVAQGLAFGLRCRLLPLDSLMIVAEDARLQLSNVDDDANAGANAGADQDVAVLMDARMDEVYAARYRWHAGRWQVLQAPALYSLPALHTAWADAPLQVLAGTALAAFGPRLALPSTGPRLMQEQDRAAALLRVAVQVAADGPGVEPADALPLYLRDKVAQTTVEREQAKAAAVVAAALAP